MDRPQFYFIAHHLRRRWPELASETAVMSMGDVPKTRWAPLENIWIVSTYLRLRAAGEDVRISDQPVLGCINVCCDTDVAAAGLDPRCFIVVTQGDRDPIRWADHRLVQSPVQAKGPHTTLIGHWPQPGLLARDPARGSRIERVGYVGPVENLAVAFRDERFAAGLASRGVEFVIRDNPDHWHDFSDLDLYLAVRDWPWRLIRTKPATKLVHAWLTGVPALLGNEPSYRYRGRSGEDYFEVQTPEQALAVVDRLRADPRLYDAVRQRGFEKAKLHDESAVLKQWVEILNGPVRDAFEEWRQARLFVWKYRAVKRYWQRVAAPVQQKLFTARSRGWRAVQAHLMPRDRMAAGGGATRS